MNENSKTSKPFRLLWVCGFLVAMTLSSTAKAQVMRFNAEIKQDGSVELIPIDADAPSGFAKSTRMTETVSGREFFLVRDSQGAVKGVYADQNDAMGHNLSAGDSVEVLAAAETLSFWPPWRPRGDVDGEMLDKVAQEAAKRLLATMKASTCEFDPLPETVSPSVEVSFNLFAGASLSLQATWITANVCKD